MKIELPKAEYFYDFASRLEESLPDTKATWLPYLSVDQALFDLSSALALTYSHKMSLAIIGEESPYFKRLAIHFSRLGYNVQTLKKHEVAKESEWVESLNNHTLFVLAEEDDALTGEIFDHTEAREKLNEKKIFQIFVSHNKHRFRDWSDLEGFESRVYSTENGRALLGLGSRAKIQPVHVLSNDFRFEKIEDYSPRFNELREAKESIEKLENSKGHGAKPYFEGEQRLYDRAALLFSGVSGDAVRGELLSDLPANQHSKVVSFSLSEWRELEDHKSLKPGADGLLLIDPEIITDSLSDSIGEAFQRVLKMQGPA